MLCFCSCSPFPVVFPQTGSSATLLSSLLLFAEWDQALSLPHNFLVARYCLLELCTTLHYPNRAQWSFGIDIWLQSPTHSILQMLLLLLLFVFFFFSFGPLTDRSSFEFLRASCEIVWNPSNKKALIYYAVILMRTTPCTFHLKSRDL